MSAKFIFRSYLEEIVVECFTNIQVALVNSHLEFTIYRVSPDHRESDKFMVLVAHAGQFSYENGALVWDDAARHLNDKKYIQFSCYHKDTVIDASPFRWEISVSNTSVVIKERGTDLIVYKLKHNDTSFIDVY